MFVLLTIYFRINFDFVLVYYTDDGSLELGSKMSGIFLQYGNVLIIIWKCLTAVLIWRS